MRTPSVAHGNETPPEAALLDLGTQLAEGVVEGSTAWSVTIFPEVGEATAAHVRVGPVADTGKSQWSSLDEEERLALNRDRAQRRSRSRLRRYSVRNHLRVMWTLTYMCTTCKVAEGCVCGLASQPGSRAEVREHVNRFVTRLRNTMRLDAFPYAYVVERGSRGTRRLHVHLLSPPGHHEDVMELVWGHGTVDMAFRADGVGGREGARRAAAYAAKYVGKALGDEDPAWAHSYERSQGFNVREVKARCQEMWDGLELAAAWLGSGVEVTRSLDWEDYYGPPAWAMSLP
jgi:hypothetical protein